MILYLLVPALVLGDVRVRNTTAAEEPGQLRINVTMDQLISDHGWREPDNSTSSLDEDRRTRDEEEERTRDEEEERTRDEEEERTRDEEEERTRDEEEERTRDEEERTLLEEELQGNTTSDLVTEDEETFQDQENLVLGLHCDRELLLYLSHAYCGGVFHQEMAALSADGWCVLENVIRPYNDLSLCLELQTRLSSCFFPNADVQDFLVEVHSLYFQSCRQEAPPSQEDAPHGVVVALTLLPVSLIPVFVSVLVCQSKAAA